MSQTKLPVRIKVDVRDQFDASNSAVQKAFTALAGILGLKVQCNVEWSILYFALEPLFEDKGTFVPNIVDTIVIWCDVLSTRFEDEKFASWTDEVLNKISDASSVKLHLQTSDSDRPTTVWSDEHHGFLLCFPQKVKFYPTQAASGFEADFQELFTYPIATSQHESVVIRNKDDDWAEITESGESASVSVSIAQPNLSSKPARMPSVASLPALDLFLKSTTPYILHVQQKGPGRFFESGSSRVYSAGSGRTLGQGSSTLTEQGGGNLIIQGTHSPSLQFLEQYLQRWIRRDHQDVRKVPLLRITLYDSNFGIGMSHDTLTIEPYDDHQEKRGICMNVTVVLLLIENVLGYYCLPRISAGNWEYRRDVPFE